MDEDVWLKYIVCNGDESHIHGIELCYFNLPLEPGLSLAFSNFSVLSFPNTKSKIPFQFMENILTLAEAQSPPLFLPSTTWIV